ncbi:MAG: hypothetical protein EBY44_00955, partial [Actinobacteria bacterium]|nr:hypothetical protein [Actinomycetota bacterium]
GQQVLGAGQDEAALPAGEHGGEGQLELAGDVVERLLEHDADALVDRLDHAEIAARTSTPALEVAAEIRAGLSAIRNHMTAMAPV